MGHVQKLVELIINFKVTFSVTVGFVYSRWRSTVTDAEVYTGTLHTSFFSCTVHVFNDVQSHHMDEDEPLIVSV